MRDSHPGDFLSRRCSARIHLLVFGSVEGFEKEELSLHYRVYYRETENYSLVEFVLRGCSAMFRPCVFVGLGDFGSVL